MLEAHTPKSIVCPLVGVLESDVDWVEYSGVFSDLFWKRGSTTGTKSSLYWSVVSYELLTVT
jgi:hypothetical protein